jgi:hypothetical protein
MLETMSENAPAEGPARLTIDTFKKVLKTPADFVVEVGTSTPEVVTLRSFTDADSEHT